MEEIKLRLILKQVAIRPTKRRMQILSLFIRSRRYYTAKEAREWFKEKYDLVISFDTLYKNLQGFVDAGLLYEFTREGERMFFYEEQKKHFAICTKCHKVTPLMFNCPVSALDQTYGNIESHKFELYVTCETCLTGEKHEKIT